MRAEPGYHRIRNLGTIAVCEQIAVLHCARTTMKVAEYEAMQHLGTVFLAAQALHFELSRTAGGAEDNDFHLGMLHSGSI